ncbi:hypothetical protein HanPSC8_Chr02g0069301 [Helianthus annuus]|nr:hypothetical protein HanPSC8_Chr02g0069301 [Helianthus annuus]
MLIVVYIVIDLESLCWQWQICCFLNHQHSKFDWFKGGRYKAPSHTLHTLQVKGGGFKALV